jgi:hypothetical protein
MKDNKNRATLPRFYPFEVAPTIKWTSFTYSPVKETETPNGLIIEAVDDIEADYWSVYLKCVDGCLVCVADVRTQLEASDLGKVILNSAEQFNLNNR